MKKLIAQRPIQYMGRFYGPGDALPAHDGQMLEAWLNAGTAAWDDTEAQREAVLCANIQNANNAMAVGVLNAMGVRITDENGAFVGVPQLADRIVAVVQEHAQEVQKPAEGDADAQEGQEPTGDENEGQGGREGGGEGKEATPAATPDMLTGHLDAADLERWKKADLEKLAGDMGVDLSGAKNNAERAALIAAVEVRTAASGTAAGATAGNVATEAPAQETGGAR